MEKLSERRKSSATIETLNEEISALQFQLSAEQMQKSETQVCFPLEGLCASSGLVVNMKKKLMEINDF